MNFHRDLSKGEECESKVIESLNNKYGLNFVKNKNKKGVDITLGIEVKLDLYSARSGNNYIEFESNNTASGICKEEDIEVNYWIICNSEGECGMFNKKELEEFTLKGVAECRENKSLTSKGLRLIEAGGDGGRTKGLLVPSEKLTELAIKIFSINK